jgi:hypothetical protein
MVSAENICSHDLVQLEASSPAHHFSFRRAHKEDLLTSGVVASDSCEDLKSSASSVLSGLSMPDCWGWFVDSD